MSIAPPKRGSVIRYAYLWADEHWRGRSEGRKDRPSLVISLSVRKDDGEIGVLVVAITHARPTRAQDAVSLPSSVQRQLGLDDEPAWIVTTEANAFVWPGPDIRPIRRERGRSFVYGEIPQALLKRVVESYLVNANARRTNVVVRSP